MRKPRSSPGVLRKTTCFFRSGFPRILLGRAALAAVFALLATASVATAAGLTDTPSAFLRAQADAPVHWLPWGEEAFARASREKKPLFLAIGSFDNEFAAAMHQQSFANPEVAAFFNQHFVCVLIDREQRSDVAELFQEWVQANRQLSGWPVNVWLTSDLKPYEGSTYLPPSEEWGKEGLLKMANRAAATWETDPAGARLRANEAIARVAAAEPAAAPAVAVEPAAMRKKLDAAATAWLQTFDPANGGFGGAPKYPEPELLRFLLRREGAGRDAALATLRAIVRGALRDHVDGGFFRYTSDAAWRMPVFQKTLLAQARLALVLTDAVELSGDPEFASALRSTLDMVATDFAAAGGGFIIALDATSEDATGYFLWTAAEISEVLGPDRAAAFARAYHVKPEGNVSPEEDPSSRFSGKNILYRTDTQEAAEQVRLRDDCARLRAVQVRRHPLRRDESVQAGPNGLILAALARAGAALKEPRYLELARNQWRFLQQQIVLPGDGGVRHVIGDETAISQAADDLLVAEGAAALAVAAHDSALNAPAEHLVQEAVRTYLDGKSGRYFAALAAGAPGFWRRPYCTEYSAGGPASPEALTVGLIARLPGAATAVPAAVRNALAAGLSDSSGPARGDVLLALAADSADHR